MSTCKSIGMIPRPILALFLLFITLSSPLSINSSEVAVVRTEWVSQKVSSVESRVASFSYHSVATIYKIFFSAFDLSSFRHNQEKKRKIQENLLKHNYESYKTALQKRLFQSHLKQFLSYPSFSEPV